MEKNNDFIFYISFNFKKKRINCSIFIIIYKHFFKNNKINKLIFI